MEYEVRTVKDGNTTIILHIPKMTSEEWIEWDKRIGERVDKILKNSRSKGNDTLISNYITEVKSVATLRNKLKEFRHDRRMNQKEFSSFLGISPYQYSRYENNKVQPQLETALEISEKLNISVNELFERTPEE